MTEYRVQLRRGKMIVNDKVMVRGKIGLFLYRLKMRKKWQVNVWQ